MMQFIYITNCPNRALAADAAGVDNVMVDLEINGKASRQGHLDTVISNHHIDDIQLVRASLRSSRLMVRVNPMYSETAHEIERCLAAGAETIMLPMFTNATEVTEFIDMIHGRAKTCLLLETAGALANLDDILTAQGIDALFIGLNDLHLSLRLDFMFEPVSNGIVERVGSACRKANVLFGFGGVARIGRGAVPAELVLSEHVRLGSSLVILSRDFNAAFDSGSTTDGAAEFAEEVSHLRRHFTELSSLPPQSLDENSLIFKHRVASVAARRRQLHDRLPA